MIGQRHPGHEPRALRGGHVQQEPGDEHRLGHVSDPPLQGLSAGHERPRPADRPAVARLGRAADLPDHRRDRERVLRRDRRAAPRGADHPGPRPRDAQGSRRQLARRRLEPSRRQGPERSGPCSNRAGRSAAELRGRGLEPLRARLERLGITRTSPSTGMKFVSPTQRGTTWRCRWSTIPAPAVGRGSSRG